ncbi:hypothetical protein [Desulforamulus aquiferis]|nr:hypothetical protein [Desulforamulus aquiferis]
MTHWLTTFLFRISPEYFVYPIKKTGDCMYIFGLFEPSLDLELGLKKLRSNGFKDGRLIVVPLEISKHPGKQTILDSMYKTDGMSLIDGIAILSSIGMVLGVIYGSIVFIGPIALGLIGMVVGGGIGYILDKHFCKRKRTVHDTPSGDIVVAVNYKNEDEAQFIETVMKEHKATALGRGNA